MLEKTIKTATESLGKRQRTPRKSIATPAPSDSHPSSLIFLQGNLDLDVDMARYNTEFRERKCCLVVYVDIPVLKAN